MSMLRSAFMSHVGVMVEDYREDKTNTNASAGAHATSAIMDTDAVVAGNVPVANRKAMPVQRPGHCTGSVLLLNVLSRCVHVS